MDPVLVEVAPTAKGSVVANPAGVSVRGRNLSAAAIPQKLAELVASYVPCRIAQTVLLRHVRLELDRKADMERRRDQQAAQGLVPYVLRLQAVLGARDQLFIFYR